MLFLKISGCYLKEVISRDNQDEVVFLTKLKQKVFITKYLSQPFALIYTAKLINYTQFSEFQQKLFLPSILKKDRSLNVGHFTFHL